MAAAGRTVRISIALAIVAVAAQNVQAAEGTQVGAAALQDWLVLPSLMGGNGEIIVASGALFLPWRRVREIADDYDDAVRIEAGVGLGGVHASAGVTRLLFCPHVGMCICPYVAPEVYRAAWLTNWTPRTYAGLDLGVTLVIFKVSVGALHAAEDRSSIYWQVRVGFGW